jgi:DNA-nicking Smr family endonuclease
VADEELFHEAMAGVERLDRDGARVVRPPRGQAPAEEETAAPTEFELELWGEQMTGLAKGADGRELSALRRGTPAPRRQIDLHGYTGDEARAEVRRFLGRALDAGLDCVSIVHGRGKGSEEGPVLKRALPGWLAEPPHGAGVLAFTTAPPRMGGAGATLVLLRAKRGGAGR